MNFGQVFLAAPDVDRDLFLDLARLYPEHAERTTLYASDADLAVHLSRSFTTHHAPATSALHRGPGIDTVAVPDFDVDLLGHSYYAQAEALLTTSAISCATTRRRRSGSGSRPRCMRAQLFGG